MSGAIPPRTIGSFNSIFEVKSHNRNQGYHWFDADTLRWFNGKVYDVLFGSCVFVSSEKENYSRFTPNPQRQYSVRVAMNDGSIERYGVYDTKRQADREAQWLAKALANGTMVHCNSRNKFVEPHLIHWAHKTKAVTLEEHRKQRRKQ